MSKLDEVRKLLESVRSLAIHRGGGSDEVGAGECSTAIDTLTGRALTALSQVEAADEPDTKRVIGMLEAGRKVLLEGWEHDGLSSQEAAAVHILVQRAIVDLGGELVANALPLAER